MGYLKNTQNNLSDMTNEFSDSINYKDLKSNFSNQEILIINQAIIDYKMLEKWIENKGFSTLDEVEQFLHIDKKEYNCSKKECQIHFPNSSVYIYEQFALVINPIINIYLENKEIKFNMAEYQKYYKKLDEKELM